jgi:hypothetical protein
LLVPFGAEQDEDGVGAELQRGPPLGVGQGSADSGEGRGAARSGGNAEGGEVVDGSLTGEA